MVTFATGTSPVLSTAVDAMAGVIDAEPIFVPLSSASRSQMVTSCSPPLIWAVGLSELHHQSRWTLPSMTPENGATQYIELGSSGTVGSSSSTLVVVCVRSAFDGAGGVVSNVAVGAPAARLASSLAVPWNQNFVPGVAGGGGRKNAYPAPPLSSVVDAPLHPVDRTPNSYCLSGSIPLTSTWWILVRPGEPTCVNVEAPFSRNSTSESLSTSVFQETVIVLGVVPGWTPRSPMVGAGADGSHAVNGGIAWLVVVVSTSFGRRLTPRDRRLKPNSMEKRLSSGESVESQRKGASR